MCVFFSSFRNIFFFQIKMYNFITQKQKFIISIHVLQQINRIFSLAGGVGCVTVGVVCQVDNQLIKGQINSSVIGSVLLLALVCVFASIFPSTGFDVFKCLCRDLLILCVMFLEATIYLTWLQINSVAFRSGWYGGSGSTSCPYSRKMLSMRYVGSRL